MVTPNYAPVCPIIPRIASSHGVLPWQMNRIFTIIYYLFLQFNLFFANWIFVLKKAVYHYGKRPVNMY